MIQALINVFKIPERGTRSVHARVLWCTDRLLDPLRCDQEQLIQYFQKSSADSSRRRGSGSTSRSLGRIIHQSTIFGLGIMPYIRRRSIFPFDRGGLAGLKNAGRGPDGPAEDHRWTRTPRRACVFQAVGFLTFIRRQNMGPAMDPTATVVGHGVMTLTAGTVFLMWLGEQIDRYGIATRL